MCKNRSTEPPLAQKSALGRGGGAGGRYRTQGLTDLLGSY